MGLLCSTLAQHLKRVSMPSRNLDMLALHVPAWVRMRMRQGLCVCVTLLCAGYMLPPGAVQLSAGDAPLASGKEAAHFAADDQEPCAGGGWLAVARCCLLALRAGGHGMCVCMRACSHACMSVACRPLPQCRSAHALCLLRLPMRTRLPSCCACPCAPASHPMCRGGLGRLLWGPAHAGPHVPGAAALLPRVRPMEGGCFWC